MTATGMHARPSGRRGALGALALGLAVLGGCAIAPDAPDIPVDGSWRGRFSVTLVDPQPSVSIEPREERAQGRFTLERSAGIIDLALFSPFGQKMAVARSTPAGATLVTSDEQTFRAEDADLLVERALGWRLPVSALPDWLSGRRLPADGDTTADGWHVDVEQRFDNELPRRLAARWPANPRVDERALKLYVVVDGAAR